MNIISVKNSRQFRFDRNEN